MPQLYYPRVGATPASKAIYSHLPTRPTLVGPVLDASNAQTPLSEFDQCRHASIYPGRNDNGEALEPDTPDVVPDLYLRPSLSANEHVRLTTLWYYTRGVEQDEELLSSIDISVKTLQKAIGWEFTIAGILDEATYTRLVTANLPIAILPRGESTCSHTVLQEPGSVFMVTDMSNDWRFKRSPHVDIGGLRSYAGTQLKFTTQDGQHIALGSLCVASNSVQAPLSLDSQTMLIRCAEQIVFQITSRARRIRLRERQTMSDIINKLRGHTSTEDLETLAVRSILEIFPGSIISFQDSLDQNITLRKGLQVPIDAFVDGIWENVEIIDAAIKSSNFERLRSEQAVRAIIARCGFSHRYLVVDSDQIQYVFDDFDSWFVERCANALSETLQTQRLAAALEANENFLRGMTHQLRTPLHGILGSADLLAEDLASIKSPAVVTSPNAANNVQNFPMTYVSTIRSAGKELMMTINNIIRLNRLTELDVTVAETQAYDLRCLELDIVDRILDLTSEQQLSNLSIRVEHNLSADRCIVTTDVRRLKDCLESLLMNAIQAVAKVGGGVVKMLIHASNNSKVQIDVIDAGCGIKREDRNRIFEPYEKVDHYTPGAGVGLTLARRIAQRLDGTVELLASEETKGSTFRVTMSLPVTACQSDGDVRTTKPIYLPRNFCQAPHSDTTDHVFEHISTHLRQRGFSESPEIQSGIVLSDLVPGSDEFASQFQHIQSDVIVLTYASLPYGQEVVRFSEHVGVIDIGGVICTKRLDDHLLKADLLFKKVGEQSPLASDKMQTVLSPVSTLAASMEFLGVGQERTSPPTPTPSDGASRERGAESVLTKGSTSSPAHRSRPVKALLVDDNTINLRILRLFCSKRSIPYLTATDGNQAIHQYTQSVNLSNHKGSLPCYCAACHENAQLADEGQRMNCSASNDSGPTTLVLMDLQMPECSGIEATKFIRRLEKEFELTPSIILMVTGQDSAQDRKDALNAGADEYIVKPIGIKVLEQRIRRYFGEPALL